MQRISTQLVMTALVAAVVGFGSAFTAVRLGLRSDHQTIRVKKVELIDQQGKTRGVLESTSRGSELVLMDTAGRRRAVVAVQGIEDQDSAVIEMHDSQNHSTFKIGVSPNQSSMIASSGKSAETIRLGSIASDVPDNVAWGLDIGGAPPYPAGLSMHLVAGTNLGEMHIQKKNGTWSAP